MKEFLIMVLGKLKQKSTWSGILIPVITGVWASLSPEQAGLIATVGISLAGIILVVIEPKSK